MLASIAEGNSQIDGFLSGEDSLATLQAFRAMGVPIGIQDNGRVAVEGVGLHGLRAAGKPLDLGNSGTCMRLLAGLLAGQAFDSELVGDASLMSRPMQRIVEPLRAMGAHIESTVDGTAPLRIRGGAGLRGIDYLMPVASAQVKSCLLLAGLYAAGKTCITERQVTRDHTERMLAGLGYPVQHTELRTCVSAGGRLQGKTFVVPADLSSAAFFMVGASIMPDSRLLLQNVGVNPSRTGAIHILRQMGADIRIQNERDVAGEPVADIEVHYSPLHGIAIEPEHVSLAIDEFPILFIAAACAEGHTVLTQAAELKVKESDRLESMAQGLRNLGIEASASDDGMHIVGGTFRGGTVDSQGDHRIAMAFSIAGLRSAEAVEIRDCQNVTTSFPGFVETARAAGLHIEAFEV